ncbi:MAG: hypothetical protein V9G12_06750 [Microthrixaceae bacterium]
MKIDVVVIKRFEELEDRGKKILEGKAFAFTSIEGVRYFKVEEFIL